MNALLPLARSVAANTEAGAHHAVPASTTYLFCALLVAMIVTLAIEEKIHAKKSLIVGIYAAIALFLGVATHVIPGSAPIHVLGETLTLPIFIPAVDWGVITIILGSSIFVDVTSQSGLFTWIAIRLTKKSGGDPYRLLWFYGLMTVVFSAVLNNVTAMIIVGSLTGVSLKKLGREDKLLAFLLVEGLLTNIGGLLTLISSVPNIIVGQAAHISFVKFFLVASPYVALATAVTLIMGAKIGGITRISDPEEKARAQLEVNAFDENDGIQSQGFFWFATAMFMLFILVLASTSVLPVIKELNMGYVAGVFGLIMLLRYKSSVDTFYKSVDWDLLGFFGFLFMVINVMEHAQVLTLIGHGLGAIIGLGAKLGSAALLVAAAVASSVTDNIPLAAMLAKILSALPEPPAPTMWWAVVFGANLGGNITPIGSASTVVAVTIIHKNKLALSFGGFVKAALPYAALQILLALLYVVLVLSAVL